MPKAILEFNLPEEQDEFMAAINGADWKGLVWELDQWLRDAAKYGGKEVDGVKVDPEEAFTIREQLRWMMEEEDLKLD